MCAPTDSRSQPTYTPKTGVGTIVGTLANLEDETASIADEAMDRITSTEEVGAAVPALG